MSVTVTIDEALLYEAERATNIHDWSTLVKRGLQVLSQRNPPTNVGLAPFDFDAVLDAANDLPDLSDADFEQFGKEMQRPLSAA